jgi:BirA family biotin operon repressor/biotin-[acetyl-CoA-carboxylase] ligase
MVTAVTRRFAEWSTVWRERGFAPIRTAWLSRAAGLGEPIQVRLERATLDGRFLDLDGDGALLLGTPSGERRIAAGEVFPVAA